MTFTELRYALKKAGFEVAGIHANRYVRAGKWSFFYPVVKSVITKRTASKAPDDHHLLSREILEGEIIIVEARRKQVS